MIKKKEKFSQDELWSYMIGACLGMAHAHKKRVMHGDLMTSSLFLKTDKDNEESQILKIGGFGQEF